MKILLPLIVRQLDYLKSRTSSKVIIITDFDPLKEVLIPVNSALFRWVIENVLKNAMMQWKETEK